MQDPIPQSVRQVLELFGTDLASVNFAGLEQGVLVEAAESTTSAAEAVAEAESALERARAALSEKQEQLLQKAHRALSYARIYAEDNAPLLAKVEAIGLPKLPRRTAKADKVEKADKAVSAEAVSAEAVSAEAVSAEAVSTEAVSIEAGQPAMSEPPQRRLKFKRKKGDSAAAPDAGVISAEAE